MDGLNHLDETTRNLILEQQEKPGVDLDKLDPGIRLTIKTRNSTYEAVIIDKSMVNIEGGTMKDGSLRYSYPTPVFLQGSNWGGSLIKLGWVGVGMNLEIYDDLGRILTSPIIEIRVAAADESWHYDLEDVSVNASCNA